MIKEKTSNLSLHFAICLDNRGYEVSLQIGKLYRIIPDDSAGVHRYIRVIDESGEDYAYASNRFFPVALPPEVENVLLLQAA
ncbi:hypothetical protein BH10CHL1_BH10CHL1_31160 [soil metagenome]